MLQISVSFFSTGKIHRLIQSTAHRISDNLWVNGASKEYWNRELSDGLMEHKCSAGSLFLFRSLVEKSVHFHRDLSVEFYPFCACERPKGVQFRSSSFDFPPQWMLSISKLGQWQRVINIRTLMTIKSDDSYKNLIWKDEFRKRFFQFHQSSSAAHDLTIKVPLICYAFRPSRKEQS